MPAQCFRRQAQIAVRTVVRLVGHFLVSGTPAGPLAAPQRATCGVWGPCYTKVRPGVCLVAHFLTTRGQWGWRILVSLLQTDERKELCYYDVWHKIEPCYLMTCDIVAFSEKSWTLKTKSDGWDQAIFSQTLHCNSCALICTMKCCCWNVEYVHFCVIIQATCFTVKVNILKTKVSAELGLWKI